MLKDKAIENLEAGEILLQRGMVQAATSRLYYAMFQAAVWRLGTLGITPSSVRSGALRWDHAMVANNTVRLRGKRTDRDLYNSMMHLRVRADYSDSAVAAAEVEDRLADVRAFVEELS